jgi:hypothetical protein
MCDCPQGTGLLAGQAAFPVYGLAGAAGVFDLITMLLFNTDNFLIIVINKYLQDLFYTDFNTGLFYTLGTVIGVYADEKFTGAIFVSVMGNHLFFTSIALSEKTRNILAFSQPTSGLFFPSRQLPDTAHLLLNRDAVIILIK